MTMKEHSKEIRVEAVDTFTPGLASCINALKFCSKIIYLTTFLDFYFITDMHLLDKHQKAQEEWCGILLLKNKCERLEKTSE